MNVAVKFISDYFHVIGWTTLILFVWRASANLTTFTSKFDQVSQKAEVTEGLVSSLSTNHIPHLQSELEKINRNLEDARRANTEQISGLRHDLLVLFTSAKN